MIVPFLSKMSRLKKKLLIYFVLVAIVSISVSAEIILELSSRRFKDQLRINFYTQLEGKIPDSKITLLKKTESKKLWQPIYDLRNRMILLLIVVSLSIMSAFFLFIKDIISPMDEIVAATKKIAEGDLTVNVPVISEDEIGQIGDLINNMNNKLLDMIVQVKQDLNRHKDKINAASNLIKNLLYDGKSEQVIEKKTLKVSEFKNMMKLAVDVVTLLGIMTEDLTSLQTFINMYKTYSIKAEISQDEIEDAIRNYQNGRETEGDSE